MVRCPAAAVGHDMWPLWLIFDDLGGVDGRVLAGIVGGVLHNRDLLEGYCLDCYCCGVPVCVLVSLVAGCEGAFMEVVCGRYRVDESLLVFVHHLIFHHDGFGPYVAIFSLGCFIRGRCLSLVVGLSCVRVFGLDRYCVIKEAI